MTPFEQFMAHLARKREGWQAMQKSEMEHWDDFYRAHIEAHRAAAASRAMANLMTRAPGKSARMAIVYTDCWINEQFFRRGLYLEADGRVEYEALPPRAGCG